MSNKVGQGIKKDGPKVFRGGTFGGGVEATNLGQGGVSDIKKKKEKFSGPEP